MVFSSLKFILIFMPIFFGCYYLVPARFKNPILLLGSLAFYLVGTLNSPEHFLLFINSIALDFVVGVLIDRYRSHKKFFLIIGIVFHLFFLGMFKYANFIFGEMRRVVPEFDIVTNFVLPIGISFYTFQGISYIIDVYRGTVKAEKSLLDYAVYISMFEQLIAGPIVTYGNVAKELHTERRIKPNVVVNGFGVFVFGLGLKVLLANPLGKLWSQAGAIGYESLSTPLAWLVLFAYTFQIYFDFFGYSLMAIGMGKMLGFKLPKNFDHPYTSKSMTEFWRRWHITLGSWFREYVYIPLGGNRKGIIALIRNMLAVWLLTGIWHGAGYNFLLWGNLLFVVLIIERFVIGRFLNKVPVVGHLYMLLLIPLSWMVFAIEDVGQLKIFFTRLFPFFFGESPWSIFKNDYIKYLKMYYPFLIAGILFSTKLPYRILQKIKSRIVIWLLLLIIFGASLYCMYQGYDDPFLYFRF